MGGNPKLFSPSDRARAPSHGARRAHSSLDNAWRARTAGCSVLQLKRDVSRRECAVGARAAKCLAGNMLARATVPAVQRCSLVLYLVACAMSDAAVSMPASRSSSGAAATSNCSCHAADNAADCTALCDLARSTSVKSAIAMWGDGSSLCTWGYTHGDMRTGASRAPPSHDST